MILCSSNKFKIKEFQRILGDNLTIQSSKDLKEVDGTALDVIIYKSLEAGKNFIVEDTILTVDGKEVVDIRWSQDEVLKEGLKSEWIVSLGYNDGTYIYVYQGIITGTIVKTNCNGYGFDPYFLPTNSSLTLCELDIIGKKDDFSARVIALKNLKNNLYIKKIKISDIPTWNGNYQNEN
jgi:inosine/xanthosine triphosphate pyrophosphatase family protein